MRTVRRLYLYMMTAVGLATLAVGLDRIAETALDQLLAVLGPATLVGPYSETVRSNLSLGLSLVAVGGPLWVIHWWFAQRGVGARTPAGEAERTAPVRAFYLAFVEFVAGVVTMMMGSAALTTAVGVVSGQSGMGMSGALAIALVGGPLWAYHRWVRRGDERAGELSGAAAWWPRLSRLALTFTAGIMTSLGASGLLGVGLQVALRTPGTLVGPDWWIWPFSSAVGEIVVGAAGLVVLLGLDGGLVGASDWRGASERDAALRRGYAITVVLTGTLAILLGTASGLAEALRWVLGASETTDPGRLLELAGGPPVTMLPLAVWGWWHGVRLGTESERWHGPEGRASAIRMRGYAVTLAGLLFAGIGCGWLVGLAIDVVFGGRRTIGGDATFWRGELGWYAAFAVVGIVVWAPAWAAVVRRRVWEPAAEAASTARRAALYLAIGGALVSGLGGLVLVVYRTFGILLGARVPYSLASDLSTPVGVVIAAAAIVGYHGLALRSDLRQAVPAIPAPVPAALPLVLVGPPGADLAAVLPALGEHLPPGYDLRVAVTRPAGGAAGSGKDDPG